MRKEVKRLSYLVSMCLTLRLNTFFVFCFSSHQRWKNIRKLAAEEEHVLNSNALRQYNQRKIRMTITAGTIIAQKKKHQNIDVVISLTMLMITWFAGQASGNSHINMHIHDNVLRSIWFSK